MLSVSIYVSFCLSSGWVALLVKAGGNIYTSIYLES